MSKIQGSGEPKYVDAVDFVTDLPTETPTPTALISSSLPMLPSPTPIPRRSSRSMKGQRTEALCQNTVFHAGLNNTVVSHQDQLLSYHAVLQIDYETGEYSGSEPRTYAASHKPNKPYMPSFHDALHGEASHQYIEVMKLQVSQLIKQKTWKIIDKDSVLLGKKVRRGTWALKLKRLPDGTPSKYKGR